MKTWQTAVGVIMGLAIIVGFAFGMCILAFNDNNVDNEKDVVQHLGISIGNNYQVPHGQTVRFYLNTNANSNAGFTQFMQFMHMYNVTRVYFVDKKPNNYVDYQGCALYFVYEGVIFLYQ